MSAYEAQANDFLTKHGLVFKAAWQGCNKLPPWHDAGKDHGDHYRVTIKRVWGDARKSISFDFWGSIADREAGNDLNAYDVLACISGDLYCPETFAGFCDEYGYDQDSRKAEQQFKACDKFARKLRAFFSEAEREELSEIR